MFINRKTYSKSIASGTQGYVINLAYAKTARVINNECKNKLIRATEERLLNEELKNNF